MAVWYLILAHRDLAHLLNLIGSIDESRAIIHIDKNSKIASCKSEISQYFPKALILDENSSLNVKWGGFSQVESMLTLMRIALTKMNDGDRLLFLSGSDFPIRDRYTIERFFCEHPETQFFEYYFLDKRQSDVHRWSHYHRWDLRMFKVRGSKLYRLNSLAIRALSLCETKVRGAKKNPFENLASGSSWFSLTKDCAAELLSLTSDSYDEFFRTMFAPDEIYFATLFSQSSYSKSNRSCGSFYPVSGSSRIWQARNLTYVDESLDHWLTFGDYDQLRRSEFLYARKFDSVISSTLVSQLKTSWK
jgi:hypothetical protein